MLETFTSESKFTIKQLETLLGKSSSSRNFWFMFRPTIIGIGDSNIVSKDSGNV